MTVKGAYCTGIDGTPCPLSGLNDSHASAGAPEGKDEVSLAKRRTQMRYTKTEADKDSLTQEVIFPNIIRKSDG
jgi:hypothetical protein